MPPASYALPELLGCTCSGPAPTCTSPRGTRRPPGNPLGWAKWRRQPHVDPDIELGVVLLDVSGSVFGPKLVDDLANLRGTGDRSCLGRDGGALGSQTDRRHAEDVLVPLAVRTRHGQQVQGPAVQNEPDEQRD